MKTTKRRCRNQRKRLGAAAVEFAIVSPLFILLTLGLIEVGRVVMVKQLVINASREGARLASLPGATAENVIASVQSDLGSQTISGAVVTTEPSSLVTTGAGSPVTVRISVPASSISWIPNPVFAVTSSIDAETTMRKESQ